MQGSNNIKDKTLKFRLSSLELKKLQFICDIKIMEGHKGKYMKADFLRNSINEAFEKTDYIINDYGEISPKMFKDEN